METLDALLGESLDHACARNVAHDRDEEFKQLARYLAYPSPLP